LLHNHVRVRQQEDVRRLHRRGIRDARIQHSVRGNRRPHRLQRVRSRTQRATVLRQQSCVASPSGRLRLADNPHGRSHPGRADLLLADEDARNRPLHGAGGQQQEAGEGGHGKTGGDLGRESQSHHRGFRRQIWAVYPRIPQAPWASLIGDDVHVVPPRHCLLQPEFVPEGHLHRHPLDPVGGNNERYPRGFQGGACTDDHCAVRDGPGVLGHGGADRQDGEEKDSIAGILRHDRVDVCAGDLVQLLASALRWVSGVLRIEFLFCEFRARCDDVCGSGGDIPDEAAVDVSRDIGGGGEGRGNRWRVRVLVRVAVEGSGEGGQGVQPGDWDAGVAVCDGGYQFTGDSVHVVGAGVKREVAGGAVRGD
ncbi:unnamed protein product, partial [Linum tenue]